MRGRLDNSALGFLVASLRHVRLEFERFTGRRRTMTQAELAKKIGVSRVSIAHVETGRKSMSRANFDILCDKLDVTCQGVKFGWRLHHMGDWVSLPIGARLIVTCRSTGNILMQGIVTGSSTGNIGLESDVTGGSTGNNVPAGA